MAEHEKIDTILWKNTTLNPKTGYPINWRLYDNNKKYKYEGTGKRCFPHQWDSENQRVNKEHKDHAEINKAIRKGLDKYEDRINKLRVLEKPITSDIFEEDFDPLKNKMADVTLREFAVKVLAEKAFNSLIYRVDLFHKDVKMSEINAAWILNFKNHEENRTFGKDNKKIEHNTIVLTFALLHKVLETALGQDIYIKHPMKAHGLVIPQAEETDRTWLEPEEVDEYFKLLEYYDKLPDKNSDKRYNTLLNFLMSCEASYRVSDWNTVDINKNVYYDAENKPFILIRVQKTKDDPGVRVNQRLMDILERRTELTDTLEYSQFKHHLELLTEQAKIEKHVTPHVGRHSFGRKCAKRGVSREACASFMGVTVDTVAVYYHVTGADISHEAKRLADDYVRELSAETADFVNMLKAQMEEIKLMKMQVMSHGQVA